MTTATAIGPVTNGALATLKFELPYVASVRLVGVADILFHRWNVEGVASKALAKKGSAAKKTDDIESYVYRNDAEEICIPGEYVRQAIINAAKYRPDPRSPRKSAMDLFKAGVVSLTDLASTGVTKWDFEDKRRVQVQRAGITRVRPALKQGWAIQVELLVNLPEYIAPADLLEVIVNAGRLIGLGDFRPTYGRFSVVSFECLQG